jgi:PAS domain S-box-containing protein
MAASVLGAVGVLHLLVWGRVRDRWAHLLFGSTAIGVGANAIAEARFYHAASIAEFNTAFRWSNSINGVWLVLLVWFVVIYTGGWPKRRWPAIALSVLFLAAAAANVLLPYGILYGHIDELRALVMPWGEQISTAAGPAHPWRYATDIGLLGILGLVVDGGLRLWRKGEKRRALPLGGAVALFMLTLFIGGLIDVGAVSTPYPFTYAYLVVALVMSYELAGEVVRASRLSLEVHSKEERWNTLLHNVRLLVGATDRHGRIQYVNPHCAEVCGYTMAELIGRKFMIVVPPADHKRFEDWFAQAMAGNLVPYAEAPMQTKSGEVRTIAWSTVLQRDAAEKISGLISVGADITEQRRAEGDRDRALAEVEASLREVQELKVRLEEEVLYLKGEVASRGRFDEIIGESDPLRYVLQKIEQVAPLETTVLIEGETGVGKELVARAIHAHSSRKDRPMITVNISALPSTLFEAELFGYERGAFTGATRTHRGRFELADGGTLFLDEIADVPLDLQAKLLRVLQEGGVERVGGERTIPVDVRLIAASNHNLKELVEAGKFREDLFYRLHVYPITVPALRQRREDIPLLVNTFVRQYADAHGKPIDSIPQPVMDELMAYDWPGNIRELQNVIERAVIISQDHRLRLATLLTSGAAGAPVAAPDRSTCTSPGDDRRPLEAVEREHITGVLESCGWRIEGRGGAAAVLGLHPNTLRSRMRKLGIERPAQREGLSDR